MPIDWTAFLDIVDTGRRFLLTSHMRPDCDALGSELALGHVLESLGKTATIVNGDTVPPHIAFIDPDHRIQTLSDATNGSSPNPFAPPGGEGEEKNASPSMRLPMDQGQGGVAEDAAIFSTKLARNQQCSAAEALDHDTLVVLDTSSWIQLGPMADIVRSFTGTRVVIDHHVSEGNFGATVFKDNTAEATGRLVLEATEALGVPVTPEIARPLFTAIATDTGWFRFASVGRETFAAASRLVAAGASPRETFSQLYENNRLARLRLRGRILLAIESYSDGRILFTQATRDDFIETGAAPTDTEDMINLLLTVAGSECAVLLVESRSGKTKVSLRSRGHVNVQEIAAQFGGGGHTAAAGVQYPGPLAEAKQAILDALMQSIE